MMKNKNIRLIVVLMAMLSTSLAWAADTVDKLMLSNVTLCPGGDEETQYTTLSVISAVRKYAAFNVDIYLPDGVEPAYYEGELDVYEADGGILPTAARNKYKHKLDVTYSESEKRLRLICFASPSEEFKSETGALYCIGLTASAYAKPGKTGVEMKKQNLTTADATGYEPANATYENITIGNDARVGITVAEANKWSTAILPFGIATLPEGLKAYTCSSKDDGEKVFYLTEATAMDAYTPYILYSEGGYTGTLTGTVDATLYPEAGYVKKGYLTGAVEPQTTSEGYILQKLGGEVKFYKADPTKTYNIAAGKCWATPDVNSADSYAFVFAPTAVAGIAESDGETEGALYDLMGRKAAQPQKDKIYIVKGKKIIK